MNVAPAVAAPQRPLSVVPTRSGEAADGGGQTRIPPAAEKADPLVGRYPITAYSFDADAERLVMLFRDPADGATISQIPTESALKQYREARRMKKDGPESLRLLVGGDSAADSRRSAPGSIGQAGGQPPAPRAYAPTTHAASVALADVSSSSPGPAVPAGASAAGRVNVVV